MGCSLQTEDRTGSMGDRYSYRWVNTQLRKVHDMKDFDYGAYIDKQVDIYRNLNESRKNSSRYVWSVRYKGRVIGHVTEAALIDSDYKVSQPTRHKVIAKQQRAVCAFVRGTLVEPGIPLDGIPSAAPRDPVPTKRVTFNPYTDDSFVLAKDRTPVHQTVVSYFTSTGLFIDD